MTSTISTTWYVSLFLGYLTSAVHPFIYGARDETVWKFINRKLKKMANAHRVNNLKQSPL